jgi:hypothetical protein
MTRIAIILVLVLGTTVGVLVQSQAPARLIWVARDGIERALGTLPASTYAPRLSPDGRQELIYDREDRQLYAMPLRLESGTIAGGTPKTLPVRGFMQAGARRQYDVAPDGSRFLMMFR